MACQYIDVALDPLQRVVEEVGAGAGRREQPRNHRTEFADDVGGREPRLTAHRPRYGITYCNRVFELPDGVSEQPAQRPQPDPRLAEVSLRDGFVLLRDALVGEDALGQALGVDVGGALGA